MKRNLIIIAAAMLMAGALGAQTVVGTPHDLSSTGPGAQSNSTRVCVFCHTPHQATAANGQDPLWNHTLSGTASYGVYASNTFDATDVADIGGLAVGSQSVSNLCMSCHDGSVGVASLYNEPNDVVSLTLTDGGLVVGGDVSGTALMGTSLTDDHPVNFTYDSALATADGGLVTPNSTTSVDAGGTVPLYGGKVQCASCHDPHDNSAGKEPFLVVNNNQSALCTNCHTK